MRVLAAIFAIAFLFGPPNRLRQGYGESAGALA